jgi:hypothetical protein
MRIGLQVVGTSNTRSAPDPAREATVVMRLRKVIADTRYQRGIQLLEGVVAMLTKMV